MKSQTYILAIAILMLMASIVFAQQPDTLWTRTFGGAGDDTCHSIQQTADGGFILGGSTNSVGFGNCDMYLVKTDSLGNLEWERTFGGDDYDVCYSVQQTSDGGYILAGESKSFYVIDRDIYLVKTDSVGRLEWQQTYCFGGGEIYPTFCRFGQQTIDGGYILIGDDDGPNPVPFLLCKITTSGSVEWYDYINSPYVSFAYSGYQTADCGYIIAGRLDYGNDAQMYLVKTDSTGNEEWYGCPSPNYGVCYAVRQLTDESYILCGCGNSFIQNDFCLIKTDQQGNLIWEQMYGGESNDIGYSLDLALDGGFVLGGETSSFGAGRRDMYVVKTDANGNQIWSQTIGSTGDEICYSIKETSDGGFILGGMTDYYGAGGSDMYLARLDEDIVGIPSQPTKLISLEYPLLTVHPNPFNPTTVISFQLSVASFVKLAVYDIFGRHVGAHGGAPLIAGYGSAGHHDITFDASHLPSGVYFARLTAGYLQQTQKLLLIK